MCGMGGNVCVRRDCNCELDPFAKTGALDLPKNCRCHVGLSGE